MDTAMNVDASTHNPTLVMLRNFALAAVAGGFVGYKLSRKHHVQGALLGATAIMILYGAAKENVRA